GGARRSPCAPGRRTSAGFLRIGRDARRTFRGARAGPPSRRGRRRRAGRGPARPGRRTATGGAGPLTLTRSLLSGPHSGPKAVLILRGPEAPDTAVEDGV